MNQQQPQPVYVQQGGINLNTIVIIGFVIAGAWLWYSRPDTAVAPQQPAQQVIVVTAVPSSPVLPAAQPAPADNGRVINIVNPQPQQQPSDLVSGSDPNAGGGAPNAAVFGGINGSGDPNVGGGAPGETAVVQPVAFEPSEEVCNQVLWQNELPEAGCFARWKWQREQGARSELDLYLAAAPANCQQLADEQEQYCLTAVTVATNYIISKMEER